MTNKNVSTCESTIIFHLKTVQLVWQLTVWLSKRVCVYLLTIFFLCFCWWKAQMRIVFGIIESNKVHSWCLKTRSSIINRRVNRRIYRLSLILINFGQRWLTTETFFIRIDFSIRQIRPTFYRSSYFFTHFSFSDFHNSGYYRTTIRWFEMHQWFPDTWTYTFQRMESVWATQSSWISIYKESIYRAWSTLLDCSLLTWLSKGTALCQFEFKIFYQRSYQWLVVVFATIEMFKSIVQWIVTHKKWYAMVNTRLSSWLGYENL